MSNYIDSLVYYIDVSMINEPIIYLFFSSRFPLLFFSLRKFKFYFIFC